MWLLVSTFRDCLIHWVRTFQLGCSMHWLHHSACSLAVKHQPMYRPPTNTPSARHPWWLHRMHPKLPADTKHGNEGTRGTKVARAKPTVCCPNPIRPYASLHHHGAKRMCPLVSGVVSNLTACVPAAAWGRFMIAALRHHRPRDSDSRRRGLLAALPRARHWHHLFFAHRDVRDDAAIAVGLYC